MSELIEKENEVKDVDILKSCIGLNEDGESKCTMISELLSFKGKTKEDFDKEDFYEEISKRTIRKPEYMFYPCGDFVQVVLKFKSALDPELKLLWSQLEEYGRLNVQKEIEENGMPVFSMNIMPDEYIGKYMITLNGPGFWFLQPEVFGTQILNVLKIVFPIDNVNIVKLEDIDLDKVKAEAEVQRFAHTEFKEK